MLEFHPHSRAMAFVIWEELRYGTGAMTHVLSLVGPKKTRGARIASRASFLEIQALKTLLEDSCETDVVKLKELAKKRPKATRPSSTCDVPQKKAKLQESQGEEPEPPALVTSTEAALGALKTLAPEAVLGEETEPELGVVFGPAEAVFGAKHEPLATAMLGEEPEPRVLVEPAEAVLGEKHEPLAESVEVALGKEPEPGIVFETVEAMLGEKHEPLSAEHVEAVPGEEPEPKVLGEPAEAVLGEKHEPLAADPVEAVPGKEPEPKVLGEPAEAVLGEKHEPLAADPVEAVPGEDLVPKVRGEPVQAVLEEKHEPLAEPMEESVPVLTEKDLADLRSARLQMPSKNKGNVGREKMVAAAQCCVCGRRKHEVKWEMRCGHVGSLAAGSWCYACKRAARMLTCGWQIHVLEQCPDVLKKLQVASAFKARELQSAGLDTCDCVKRTCTANVSHLAEPVLVPPRRVRRKSTLRVVAVPR